MEERIREQAENQDAKPLVDINIGGRLRETADYFGAGERLPGEEGYSAEPIVHEKDDPRGYITVHWMNGDGTWFEFGFRIRDGVAYLGSVTRVERVSDTPRWVPSEVEDAINKHHPDLTVTDDPPPWWNE